MPVYASFEIATRWHSWLPRFEHRPATFYRSRGTLYDLAPPGTRMSQPSSHVTWGPFRFGVVWP